MTTPPNAMPQSLESQPISPPSLSRARLFYWSVRRELWEYRAIYLAPLIAAAVALFGFLISLVGLPHKMRSLAALDLAHQRDLVTQPFHFVAALIMGAAFLVSIFYSLDTLYGERRDRSILFWKSLPVSDLTTVLAKTSIPLLVLPVLAFVITLLIEAILLFLSSAVLLTNGLSVATLWTLLEPFDSMFALLYHLVTVHMLWYAPFYAWFLLISAWARRAPFLWAVLPGFAIVIFEKIAFHSSYFLDFLQGRLGGGREAVGNMQGNNVLDPGMQYTPGQFLISPGLWLGLAVAVAFLFAAARLRRYRGPI